MMELHELQKSWSTQNDLIKENISLNRNVLKQLLQLKPEKRINRMKFQAIFNLVLPLAVISLILIPKLVIRYDYSFFTGLILFGLFSILTYYWAIKYAMLVFQIDFTNSVLVIKKEVAELEKYKLKITRIGFVLSPIGFVGIFMLIGFPIFSKQSILPISIILLVFVVSIVVTFKYSVFERFRKLNKEISEIEKIRMD